MNNPPVSDGSRLLQSSGTNAPNNRRGMALLMVLLLLSLTVGLCYAAMRSRFTAGTIQRNSDRIGLRPPGRRDRHDDGHQENVPHRLGGSGDRAERLAGR